MLTAVHISRQEVGRLVSKSNRCEKQGLGGGGGEGGGCMLLWGCVANTVALVGLSGCRG